jgi:hypothetical protein
MQNGNMMGVFKIGLGVVLDCSNKRFYRGTASQPKDETVLYQPFEYLPFGVMGAITCNSRFPDKH